MSTFISILEEKTEIPKIDRIGLQIRKDSATFSDNATGSIPQIDAIIKTTDGKIYKATQNLNSTYTDYNGNKTTTTNAAEPIGASMCEKFVKEYEWDAVKENDEYWMNNAYFSIAYGKGVYVSNYYNKLYYSKNGKSWNLIKEFTSEIQSICYGNSKFIVVPYDISDPYGYSTDGINWTFSDNNNDNIHPACCKIVYGNNKFVGLMPNDFSLRIFNSTDGINWTTYGNVPLTKKRMDYSSGGITNPAPNAFDIVYGNNKFVAVGCIEDIDNDYIPQKGPNLFYSTDGINWTATTISNSIVCWNHIYYINNKFYASGYRADPNNNSFVIFAYSTNGINWTEYIPKWINGTEMDPNEYSGFGSHNSSASAQAIFCKYNDNSMLGVFYDINNLVDGRKYAHIICKSTDGITWEKLYSITLLPESTNYDYDELITKYLCPKAMYYSSKDGIILVGDGSFDTMGYTKMIVYNWTINEKSGETFAYNEIMPDCISTTASTSYDYTVSTKYDANSIDKHPTGAYRFSGWSQSNITFTKDTPRVTEITGTWNWVDMVKYSYSWNAPSYSDLTGLVTLPTGGSAYVGETVSVDTKYNSDSKVEVLKWTQGTMPNTQGWKSICYGNGKFIAVTDDSDVFAYSTDGITWNSGTMPSYKEWESVCYGNGKFVAISDGSSTFAYSTDGIAWTEGTMSSIQQWMSVCYGNGKFVAVCWSSNVFAYSTDGINWTQGTMPSKQNWRSVCYGNGKFVAVSGSSSSSNVFTYSTDGITWTQGTMPSSKDWISVCYGNGKFVAVSTGPITDASNVFTYSIDGITWIEGTMPSTQGWRSVCYGNGIFVVVAYSKVFAYSTDGITWIEDTMPSKQNWMSVCYGNGKFVAVSQYSVSGGTDKSAYLTLPTSYYQFSGWNPSTDFIINENKTISGTWSKKNKLRVSYSWSNQPRGMKSKVPSDEYYHYGDNVIIDTTYNNKSGYKKYGTTSYYFKNPIETDLVYNSVGYDLGYFNNYFINYSNSAMYYSSNGINWNKSSTTTYPTTPFQYRKFSNYYIYSDYYSLSYLYTNDGITWTNKFLSSNKGIMNIINNRFIYAVYDSNTSSIKIYETSDCNTWQLISTISSINDYSTNDNFIIYIGNTYYLYTNNATYKSTNLSSWQSISSNIIKTNNVISISTGSFGYIDNKVAIIISNKISLYTTDGINWNNMPSNMLTGSFYTTNNNILIWHTPIKALYTIDGINWKPCINSRLKADNTNVTGQSLSHCVFANNMYYILDNDITSKTNILCSNDNIDKYDTLYYQFSGWNKSDFNITADTAVGGSWSQVSAGGGTNLSELSVGDTFFLGKYQVESETPWDIEWEIVHQTDSYQVAMTKQIIDLRPFDAKEPTNTNFSRKNNGNNNWQYSNIEQWMNSDQASWYSSQHQYDAPPNDDNCYKYTKDGTTVTNAYDTHKGFLYYWSADEKALLRDMTLTLANNTITDGGGSYTWTGKVWLPTYTQMGGGQNNSISEGEAFSKFTDNGSRIKTLHPNCAANNEYAKLYNYASGKTHWYWMSSAYPSNSGSVCFVSSDGSLGVNSIACYGNYGFAPCICLPRTGWSDPNKAPDLNYIT